jgi:large subunit ribosomal protein L1
MDFDRVICHDASFAALTKARLGRILGPKGMMPSQKTGTVVPNVASAMKELIGKSDYRERMGVIRMAVGQLAFTEVELQKNIKAFIEQLKKEFGAISFRADKSINEVVLSSSNSAGFSLNGEFKNVAVKPASTPVAAEMGILMEDLPTPMPVQLAA